MTPLDPKSRVALKKIMLATDFSPQSEAALPYALTIARQYGSELFVAHVISPGIADRIAPESNTEDQPRGPGTQPTKHGAYP